MNNLFFYNEYHKKNRDVQYKIVTRHDYTYQTITNLMDRHFVSRGKLIDLGCGVGTVGFYATKLGHEIVGVDLSSDAIDLARKSRDSMRIDNIKFITSDIAKYSDKTTYDYVVCSEVIEHIKNDNEVITTISKLLNKGGKLIISTPSINAPLYRWGLLNEFDNRVGHLRRYSTDQLRDMLVDNGFSISELLEVEGLLRNFLYTNDSFGWIIRFIRWPITVFVNSIDQLLGKIFGYSNMYIVATKD